VTNAGGGTVTHTSSDKDKANKYLPNFNAQ
jgi:hypothetical protein